MELARARIAALPPAPADVALLTTPNPRREPRLPFGALLEHGLLQPGQILSLGPLGRACATIQADGSLVYAGRRGSIHQAARLAQPGAGNGWTAWYYLDAESGEMRPIDELRKQLREILNRE